MRVVANARTLELAVVLQEIVKPAGRRDVSDLIVEVGPEEKTKV
jgi:hypothetical protein